MQRGERHLGRADEARARRVVAAVGLLLAAGEVGRADHRLVAHEHAATIIGTKPGSTIMFEREPQHRGSSSDARRP